jgi:hypothetical protein
MFAYVSSPPIKVLLAEVLIGFFNGFECWYKLFNN